ncbi:MAG: hypothetical protein CFH01_00509 [Alphaproteobacteria bacterium MarineAlpha2_Bin1]|nr:MAG: hypothetical protein CFH01_00509 [Alphaproteobacteria bacterium MarineAlpha2_Bin1]
MKYLSDFRPTIWSTVFAFIGFIFLLGLGTWQLDRLEWKNNLIAERQSFLNDDPILFNGDIKELNGAMWKPVQLNGTYQHDKELYLAARSMRGNVGFHVLTPLSLSNGKNILINRGWVPREKKDPLTRIQSNYKGPVELIGIITPGFKKGFFSPKNDLTNNVWLYVDYMEMSSAVGMTLQKFVIDAKENGRGGFPIGSQTRVNMPNDHLQYAVTWYLLGLTLVFVWFFWNKNRQ